MSLTEVYIMAITAAFVTSLIATAVIKKIAVKLNFVAHPRPDRFGKSIIPLGGGVAIFITIMLAFTAGIGAKSAFSNYSATFANKLPQLFIIMGCAAVLFATGLIDDIKNLSPKTKLVIQFICAFAAAYFAEVRVELFIHNKIITSFMSAFWIVLIINVFNFLDNMDGASAGIAAIVSAILFFAAALSGQVFVAGFALILTGTLAGFLVFNFCPASIFMGDAGSFVIGFFVALLTLRTTYYQNPETDRWYVVLMPLVIMALPLYDFISVTSLRLKQGKSPLVGDTQHFSHRLKKRGLTETQTVLTLYLAALATGLGAIILKIINSSYDLIVFFQIVLVLAIIAILESTGQNGQKKQ